MREREERKGRGAKNNSNGLERLHYYKYKSERGIIEPFSLFLFPSSSFHSLFSLPSLFSLLFLSSHMTPIGPQSNFTLKNRTQWGGGEEMERKRKLARDRQGRRHILYQSEGVGAIGR